jgi:hypothetical protein
MAFSSGSSWVTSLWLPPVRRTASGVPWSSVIRWRLEPARPRWAGEGPVWIPALTWEEPTMERDRSIRAPAFGSASKELVEALPGVGPAPVPQPTPAHHPGAGAEFFWEVFPLDAGVQHVQDPADSTWRSGTGRRPG